MTGRSHFHLFTFHALQSGMIVIVTIPTLPFRTAPPVERGASKQDQGPFPTNRCRNLTVISGHTEAKVATAKKRLGP
ncbi:MAG: hypothetical protein NWQ32_08910 [Paracoccaceae bacterium]|jgi:hypothetical protein|nr:hypothetical protein [Paracoccaceae bacterium]